MTRPVLVPVLLALATTCFAQGSTWIVDEAMGTGAHYSDIPAAVARAAHGDRILVRGGTYTAFTLSRGVKILGLGGVSAVGNSAQPTSYISGVPAGRTAVVQNIRFVAFSLGTHLHVQGNSGRVIVEDCQGVMAVSNSLHVHLVNCRVEGHPYAGLLVHGSRLLATRCRFGNTNGNGFGAALQNSNVMMAGCTVTGGRSFTHPNPAISLDATSILTLTDDGSSVISVSHGQASAIAGSGTLVLDPRVVLWTGSNLPLIATGINVTRRTVPYLDARGGPLGGMVNVTLKAGPGHPFFLAIGLPGNETPFPRLGGSVWLDLSTAILIANGNLDVNGAYAWAIPVPQDNTLLGLALVWQGTAGPSLGQQQLSNPSAYVHGF
jgi:hypothetical protein